MERFLLDKRSRTRVEILLSVHDSNVTHAVSSTVSQQRKRRARNIYIYIYTERVTHVEKERRIRIEAVVGAATCLNLVNKPVRMFPPRATSTTSPRWISFSLWRLARHLASHDPHLLCPAHCPARPLKSPRLFLLFFSFRERRGGRTVGRRKDGSYLSRGMPRDVLNADLSPFLTSIDPIPHSESRHFRARSLWSHRYREISIFPNSLFPEMYFRISFCNLYECLFITRKDYKE